VVERETAAVGRRCGEGGEAWGTSETHCFCIVLVYVLGVRCVCECEWSMEDKEEKGREMKEEMGMIRETR
jgi:hypothetical protein